MAGNANPPAGDRWVGEAESHRNLDFTRPGDARRPQRRPAGHRRDRVQNSSSVSGAGDPAPATFGLRKPAAAGAAADKAAATAKADAPVPATAAGGHGDLPLDTGIKVVKRIDTADAVPTIAGPKPSADAIASPRQPPPPPPGLADEAQTLDGKSIKLSDYKGKHLLLYFWQPAQQTPPPGGLLPTLSDLKAICDAHAREVADGRFAIVALSIDQSVDKTKAQVEKERLNFPVAWIGDGADGQVYDTWNIRNIPATYLIGPDGKLIARDVATSDLNRG